MDEALTGCKERLFHPKDSQTMKEAAQKGCAICPSLKFFKTGLEKDWETKFDLLAAPALAFSRRLNQIPAEKTSKINYL